MPHFTRPWWQRLLKSRTWRGGKSLPCPTCARVLVVPTTNPARTDQCGLTTARPSFAAVSASEPSSHSSEADSDSATVILTIEDEDDALLPYEQLAYRIAGRVGQESRYQKPHRQQPEPTESVRLPSLPWPATAWVRRLLTLVGFSR